MPRKFLLRAAFSDIISEVVNRRPKTGFSLPIARWMVTQLRPLCEEGVTYLSQTGFVEQTGTMALWHTFLKNPNERSWPRAFALVVLGHYLKKLNESDRCTVMNVAI